MVAVNKNRQNLNKKLQNFFKVLNVEAQHVAGWEN